MDWEGHMDIRDTDKQAQIHELQKVIERLAGDSQTSVALNVSAQIEQALEVLLISRMQYDIPKSIRNRLFNTYGPLSTFSGKIDVAYAFRLIDQTTFDGLRIIKNIRNEFAHSPIQASFSDQKISSMACRLPEWKDENQAFKAFSQACIRCLGEVVQATGPGLMAQAIAKGQMPKEP